MKSTLSISPANEGQYSAIRKIYTESFPDPERRPWESIVQPQSKYGPRLYAITMKIGAFTNLLGFITLWNFGTFVYIEHFAIAEALRGLNTGARVLSELRKKHPVIVLETERPDNSTPMAERRIGFYQRNGFHILDSDYIQPSYGPGLPEVPMILMGTDPSTDAKVVAETLRKEVYLAN